MIYRIYLAIVLNLISQLFVLAQTSIKRQATNDKISVAALKEDYLLMRHTLEALHPSLYLYTPKSTFDSIFDRSISLIDRPMSELEFKEILHPVIRNIRCGHTQIEHSVHYFKSSEYNNKKKLPFKIFVRGEQAWIVENKSNNSTLLPGLEVLSINGISIVDLIKKAITIWNGDGYNITWNEFFINEYNTFNDIYELAYGREDSYSILVRNQNGNKITLSVSAIQKPGTGVIGSNNKVNSVSTKKPSSSKKKVSKYNHLNLKFHQQSSVAIFTVKGLKYGDEVFYEHAFKQIQNWKTKNLILDIRGNHGGDIRIINNMLSYLSDTNYVLLKEVIGKVSNPVKTLFVDYFDPQITQSFIATFKRPGKQIGPERYSFEFSSKVGQIVGEQPTARKHRFRGKVYVLIDGGTFSSTSIFAAALKVYRKNIVFIGRETGGTESGCGGGTNNKLTLPNSKLIIQFPWMRLISPAVESHFGHGLGPDYLVVQTPQLVVQGIDLDIETAMRLIDTLD
jgi:hypothetical protein